MGHQLVKAIYMFVVHALVIDPIKTDKTTAIIVFCPRIKIIPVVVGNSITTRFFFHIVDQYPLFGPLKDNVSYYRSVFTQVMTMGY